jgi:hypothetical protein
MTGLLRARAAGEFGEFDGLTVDDAIRKMTEAAEARASAKGRCSTG